MHEVPFLPVELDDPRHPRPLVDVFEKSLQRVIRPLRLALDLVVGGVPTPAGQTVLYSPLSCEVAETDAYRVAMAGDHDVSQAMSEATTGV